MKDFGNIIWREWKRIFSMPVYYTVLLVLPPIIFFFFALIYQKQHIKNLSFGIWDQDQTELTRKLTFMLEHTSSIHITKRVHNQEALKQAVQSGGLWGGVHFPKNFSADLKGGRQVTVTLYTNSVSIVPAKLIFSDVTRVITTGGSGVVLQKLIKKGMPPHKAQALVQPIKLTTYSLYNPTHNYQQYIAPGLITMALQMVIIMVSVLLVNYEWKQETMEELIRTARGSPSKIILGKAAAHLAISWVNFILIVGIIFPFFGLSHSDTVGPFFVLYTVLALACIGIGIFISVLCKDVMVASDLALFYTSPAFVFSGYTFPRWAMPWYDQIYAHFMPFTPFLDGFLHVYFMELPIGYILKDLGVLLLFIAATFPAAIIILNAQLKDRGDLSYAAAA
jgi:ABC-2 type transport system permease protein